MVPRSCPSCGKPQGSNADCLSCRDLTLRRATNGPVDSIVAEQNVTTTIKQDQSHAAGDRAVYFLKTGNEVVVLTGRQAHWQDRERECKAGRFSFDRLANTLLVEEKPWMKLPRSALSAPEWPTSRPNSLRDVAAPGNQFAEITAEEMIMHLPAIMTLTC